MAARAPFRPAAKGDRLHLGRRPAAGVDRDVLIAEVTPLMNGLQLQRRLDPDGVDMAAVFADYIQGVRRAISVRPTDTSSAC